MLNALVISGEPAPFFHSGRHRKRIPSSLHSETESSPTLSRLFVSESVLSRDCVGYSSTESLEIDCGENKSEEPEHMENQDQTLKELATPNVGYQPWCIQYPQLDSAQSHELKFGEDPHKHLKEFHMVCSMMKP
ncbi:hypothetical protein CR513_01051, partial [Mucuna pruriens]